MIIEAFLSYSINALYSYFERGVSALKRSVKNALILFFALIFTASSVFLILTLAAKNPGEGSRPSVDVSVFARDEIMTCTYKSYGDDSQNMWAARALIRNNGETPIYDFRISYKIEGYSEWTSAELYKEIIPGQTVRNYCWPNLDMEKVKQVTTKTPVELKIKYEYEDLSSPVERSEKIFLLGKNDFVFSYLDDEDIVTFTDMYDNYPIVAAFVTPNEDLVKSTANKIAGGLETAASDADAYACFINCFNYLRESGLRYIMEPQGYWTERAAQYVQYPRETLERKSGTCLDLAICYAALMQAVGIKSYVAIIPGHAIPLIRLPESGILCAIESTFIDKEYAVSHYPEVVTPEVTAEECADVGAMSYNEAMHEGFYILIDIENSWANGVMPSW